MERRLAGTVLVTCHREVSIGNTYEIRSKYERDTYEIRMRYVRNTYEIRTKYVRNTYEKRNV